MPAPLDLNTDYWDTQGITHERPNTRFSLEKTKGRNVALLPREVWTEENRYRDYAVLERLLRQRSYDSDFCLAEEIPKFIVMFDKLVTTDRYQKVVEHYRVKSSRRELVSPLTFICSLPACNKYKSREYRENICAN